MEDSGAGAIGVVPVRAGAPRQPACNSARGAPAQSELVHMISNKVLEYCSDLSVDTVMALQGIYLALQGDLRLIRISIRLWSDSQAHRKR